MSDEKYLVLGSTGHQHVECVDWEIEPLPNFVDYDVIIVNVRSLDRDFMDEVSLDKITAFRNQFMRIIKSNAVLIVLTAPHFYIERQDRFPRGKINNYFWCPIDIQTFDEAGDTINIINDQFPKYFSQFKKWEYHLYVHVGAMKHNYFQEDKHKIKLEKFSLIKNREGRMLSGTISVEFFRGEERTRAYSSSDYTFSETPNDIYGPIHLLPELIETNQKESINLLLEDLLGKPQVLLPPEWVESVKMPFIDSIQKQINENNEGITTLQEEVKKLEEQKASIEEYKRLLFSDGFDLEDVFRTCLTKLGGTVEPAKYSDEEYCLVFKDKDYPIEAKGITRSVSLTHLRQVIDYMLKYEEETGESCKGILLGNAWKHKPIEERGTQDTPIFPDNVIRRACDLKIALVSSVEFFSAFCKFLDNELTGTEIIEQIVNSEGVVSF